MVILIQSNSSKNSNLIVYRDTAGQERFRSLSAGFFRDALGFLLVFDLTNESSFLNVVNWIGEIHANAYSENVNMILIGNKSDLESDRVVPKVRALEFASHHHIDYIETSALKNVNIVASVDLLLGSVMADLEHNEDISKPKSNSIKLINEQINQELLEQTNKSKPTPSFCCSY